MKKCKIIGESYGDVYSIKTELSSWLESNPYTKIISISPLQETPSENYNLSLLIIYEEMGLLERFAYKIKMLLK